MIHVFYSLNNSSIASYLFFGTKIIIIIVGYYYHYHFSTENMYSILKMYLIHIIHTSANDIRL